MEQTLQCQRQEFSLPADLHYLNCAYMGPLSRRTQQAGVVGIARKANPSQVTARDFFAETDEVRERFARLINAGEPQRIAIIPAASYGIAVVARNTVLMRGQNMVISGEQFPSNVYAWRELARRQNVELRTVKRPDSAQSAGAEWNARILEAINDDTALVALPHVHWTDGTRFDLAAIGKRAHAVGAALVVDGTQSIGALPFDQQEIRADAVICAGYKWLLGPYSIGAAYFGTRYDNGEPLEENWIARRGSDDFRGLVNYVDEHAPGAARYDVGERSNFILMPMLLSALDQILEWRPERIQAYCATISEAAIERARALGFTVDAPAYRGSHLFGLRAPAALDLEQLQQALQRKRIFASLRGSALRVSPNIYNDAADLNALVGALEEVVTSA